MCKLFGETLGRFVTVIDVIRGDIRVRQRKNGPFFSRPFFFGNLVVYIIPPKLVFNYCVTLYHEELTRLFCAAF